MTASLRKNGHPETCGPKFVVAWKQLLLGVPVGHVPHCHDVVARGVATGGREDRSGGQSIRSRRMLLPELREVESRSSLLRRASGRGNPQPNWSRGAETLELAPHSVERPKILYSCSFPRPIVVNVYNHSPNVLAYSDRRKSMISCCSRVLSLLKCSMTLFASLPRLL